MAGFNVNHVIRGTGGNAWWNGRHIATLQSAELKISGDFEEINVCGDTSTYRIYNGYSGEGTMTWIKTDSSVMASLAEAFRSGVMPDITVVTSVAQPGTNKVERIACTDVTVDELMLTKFEKKAITEQEVAFKFGNFEVLETI